MIYQLTAAEQAIADQLLSHQLDLLRLDAYARQQALDVLDNLGRELEAELRRSDLTQWKKARIEAQLKQAVTIIDRYYGIITQQMGQTLPAVAVAQANTVKAALDGVIHLSTQVRLPAYTMLNRLADDTLIHGARSRNWWQRQAGDTAFRFSNSVRQGIAAGETMGDIVSRVAGTATKPGVMQVSKQQARTLVHASVMAVSANARRDTYDRNSDILRGIQQVSTFDSHTTPICIAYAGAKWDLDNEPIEGSKLPYNGGVPRHWNCRSVEVPLTKSFKELGVNMDELPAGMRASNLGPVDAGMTFAQFLERKGVAFQEEVLGPGRAELFRKGKITLQNLLDMKGNPLSVAQLKRKYA